MAHQRRLPGQRGRGKNPLPTIREVAVMLGISRSRAQQLERSALAKMAGHPYLRALAKDYGILADHDQ